MYSAKQKSKIKLIILATLIVFITISGFFISGTAPVFYGYAIKSLPIYSVKTDSKKVCLTFDCAWGTDYTIDMLNLFDFYNIKVTYFTVQFWTEKNASFIQEINKRGHEIGTHSATHKHMSKLNSNQIESELLTSKNAIESITNKKVSLFRAPYGDYNNLLIDTAKNLGLFTIQWDVDSLDWKDISATQIAERVTKKVKNGSIVLFHNNGTNTLKALEIIIPTLINSGYTFETVNNLIYKDNYYIDANGTQIQNG